MVRQPTHLSLQILVLMTVLTLVPSIVLGMTAFTRVIIVLSILRQALGTQQTPPNQVLIAIALFITFYVMSPIFDVLYETALNPYLEGTTSAQAALAIATDLLKEFMVANTRSDTLNMFAEMAGEGPFEDTQAIPLSIVLPSFITSELKTAFEIGFLIFMPFLVIDFVIASILDVFGHDDAFTHADFASIQAFIICFSRWLGNDYWFALLYFCSGLTK